jgi:hypothetical protein
LIDNTRVTHFTFASRYMWMIILAVWRRYMFNRPLVEFLQVTD